MSKKKKRLGRGLDALLSSSEPQSTASDSSSTSNINSLPIEVLQPGQYQPHYEIIAGERRWRAAQIAQLDQVPVLVRDIPDEATLAVALIENIQRENLNPVEEALGLKRLVDEFDLTHEEMAKSVGRSRTSVTNLLRLLSLSHGAKQLLEHGKIEMGHARALLGLPVEQQDWAAAEVYTKRLNVRQTEDLVRKYGNSKKSKKPAAQKSADIRDLEEQLAEKLGTKVSVVDKNGKGKLIIEYKNLDILDGIIAHIK